MTAPADFARDGALHIPAVLSPDDLDVLRDLADQAVGARPGARLRDAQVLADILAKTGSVGALAAHLTSPATRPTRAVMFDKTPDANWAVAWHQDRTLPVASRVEVEGFGPWSTKDGVLHVAPPFEILARMITLRVHLDAVDAANAPLRAALGSHRLGRVAAEDAAARAAEHPMIDCLAQAGDVWVYATPILHASRRAEPPSRRRVLQIDYADFDLPGGLEWLGLDAA
uniref:Phytanoyl-CoA dioxygenase n=1 Tax=Caulobacter sp. (strain K31) TaxID=366602 RepID=B0T4W9_CAUSK